jgi:hypothetical protein
MIGFRSRSVVTARGGDGGDGQLVNMVIQVTIDAVNHSKVYILFRFAAALGNIVDPLDQLNVMGGFWPVGFSFVQIDARTFSAEYASESTYDLPGLPWSAGNFYGADGTFFAPNSGAAVGP